MFEVYVFEHPRFCDEFSHVVNWRFVANLTLCESLSSIKYMSEMISTFCSMPKLFSLSVISVWSRCFWASQILWWILTSSEYTHFCKINSLPESQFDRLDVWNDLNLLFNCQINYLAAKNLFCNCYKCLKYMFLSISDSVVNSHIYWIYKFLQN